LNKPVAITSILLKIYLLFTVIFSTVFATQFYPGLPTRSQNPMLQSYFIPAMPITSANQQWSFSHALYITSTYQSDQNATEELLIDIENTRYDFQISYTRELWHFNLNASLISNQGGVLDQTIESWHEFFGLPQGGRDMAENNQIQLLYQQDGQDIINSTQAEQGLGDIQLAVGYQLNKGSQLWLAIEIPSTNSSEFMSNDATDIAAWYSANSTAKSNLSSYGSIGIVYPANSGLLENRLNDHYLFGQFGLNYIFSPSYHFILQTDFHSEIEKHSQLDALDHSLQVQFGLRFPTLFENHQMELFFSEDIFPGLAPDITFGLRISTPLN